MKKFLTGTLAALAFYSLTVLSAETKYVDDTLYLGFYKNADGSGGQFTSAPSGTRLTLIEQRSGYSLVRTDKGTEGWVKSKYLVDKPPAAVRIKALEEVAARADALALEVEALNAENSALRKEIDGLLLQPLIEETEAKTPKVPEKTPASTAQLIEKQQYIARLESSISEALQALQLIQSDTPVPAEIAVAEPEKFSEQFAGELLTTTPGSKSKMAWKKILATLRATSILHYILLTIAATGGFLLGMFVLERRIRSKHGGYKIW